MKRWIPVLIAAVIAAGITGGLRTEADAQETRWVRKPNVAQYKGANWNNKISRVNGITVEEAKEIASQDPRITFFFITTGYQMVLEGKGVFRRGDAVFFSGSPWYGSAPGLADAYERAGDRGGGNESDPPDDNNSINRVYLYGRTTCGLCRGMMSRLDSAGISYTFHDISGSSDINRAMWQKVRSVNPGARSVRLPVMEINGRVFISPSWREVRDAIGTR